MSHFDDSTANSGQQTFTLEVDGTTRSYSDLNQKLLDEVETANYILNVSREPDNLTALETEEITVSELDAWETELQTCPSLTADIMLKREARKEATRQERAAHSALMGSLRDIQNRARRKFGNDQAKLSAYRIGKASFGRNTKVFEQDANLILELADQDNLPGMTPQKIAAAQTLYDDWMAREADQDKSLREQTAATRAFEQQVEEVVSVRRKIQLAADALWPYTKPDSDLHRKAFKIPANRPVTAV